MLRNLVYVVNRSPIILSNLTTTGNKITLKPLPVVEQRLRICYFERKSYKTTASKCTVQNDEESKASKSAAEDYIVPYHMGSEKILNTTFLLSALRERFRLTSTDIKRILSDENLSRVHQNRSILLSTLDTIALQGITKGSIVENPWIVAIDKSHLDAKLTLIRKMLIRDINHFIPFLRLSVCRIRKLVTSLNAESPSVPYGNRIYYISETLKVDPNVVTKYLPKRLFIIDMPFEMLEKNLNHMIRYNVSSIDVLKDLWAFRYTPKSVEHRLERANRAKKNKIMPWMVRCPESILQRSLQLSLDELAILNGKNSVAEYIAERLEFSVEETKAIMAKHPQVYRVRVTKIKEVLDYLLNEANFTRHEIAQVPRILCHSLDTTKSRIEELKNLKCRPSSLVILCRSKKEYEKFLKRWLEMEFSQNEKIILT